VKDFTEGLIFKMAVIQCDKTVLHSQKKNQTKPLHFT